MNEVVRLMAVGDLMLGRCVARRLETEYSDYPFGRIASVLEQADLLFGNLETPLTDVELVLKDGLPRFAAPPEWAERLSRTGFDVVSLANNHILDAGLMGLEDTLDALRAAGIQPVGILNRTSESQVPAIVEKKGVRIGFLAYAASCLATNSSAGAAPININRILYESGNLKSRVDHVIVSLHHGMEYAPHPSYRLYRMIQRLLRAEISIVLGHHSHVPQGVIRSCEGRVGYFSLGNFVSDMGDPVIAAESKSRAIREGNPYGRVGYERVHSGIMADVLFHRDAVSESSARKFSIDQETYEPLSVTTESAWLPETSPMSALAAEILYNVSVLARNPTERIRQILSHVFSG